MNENENSNRPQLENETSSTPWPDVKQSFVDCGKRLLARNPFYLISAGLLLWGINRFSSNPNFSAIEASRLGLNFSTLLIYELLMVLTSAFLARRAIWYDSLLLVVLESLFVLLPFSLVTRAVFVSQHLAWIMCGAGLAVAAFKLGVLKWSMPQLNLPRRLLFFGLAILLANAGLPLLFRHYAEDIMVLRQLIQWTWLALLPLLAALFGFLSETKYSGPAPAQKYWPELQLGIWLAVTAFHVAGIGYVHTLPWHVGFIAPTLWVLTWAFLGRGLTQSNNTVTVHKMMYCLPVIIPFIAINLTGNKVFFTLTALNAAIYFVLFLMRPKNLALPLAIASLVLLIAGLPEAWGKIAMPNFDRTVAVALALGGCVVAWGTISRDPRKALAGAFMLAVFTFQCLTPADFALAHALQIGLVFILLHSVRWNDENYPGAKATRFVFCALWFSHSIYWQRSNLLIGLPTVIQLSCAVLLFSILLRIVLRTRLSILIPGTAAANLLGSGCRMLPSVSIDIPGEFWAMAGSFLLFGIGTIAALTKPRYAKGKIEVAQK